LRLLPNGTLVGRPAAAGSMDFLVRVVDADGVKAWMTVYARGASG
jgi:hypothetical protein